MVISMKYWAVSKNSFIINMSYRLDLFGNIINAMVMILVNIAIWNAIYSEDNTFDGFQFNMILTYVILSLNITYIFSMDDYFIEKKIRSGSIVNDLTKPTNFFIYIFFYNFGITLFKITIVLIPSIVIFGLIFNILPPFSVLFFFAFLLSIILGYFVIYCINFIVWMTAFWFKRIFSLVTLKDVMILLFSGAVIPLWFMPQWLIDIIKLTPLDSILYTPLLIYLGQLPVSEMIYSVSKQILWIIILFLCNMILWRQAIKKIDIHGG